MIESLLVTQTNSILRSALRCVFGLILSLTLLLSSAVCLAQSDSGNAAAGELLVANRQLGLCLLCHQAPIASEKFQGNVGPNLAGVGSRLSKDELKQRIIDSRVVNPDSVMPAYFRSTQLNQVARLQEGRTIFTAQQVDDVVAYLVTLK